MMLGITHDEFPVSASLHAVMYAKYKEICLPNGKYDMQTIPNEVKNVHDVRNHRKGTTHLVALPENYLIRLPRLVLLHKSRNL